MTIIWNEDLRRALRMSPTLRLVLRCWLLDAALEAATRKDGES